MRISGPTGMNKIWYRVISCCLAQENEDEGITGGAG